MFTNMDYDKTYDVLTNVIHHCDVVKLIIYNFICDYIDYFSMPTNLQIYLEKRFLKKYKYTENFVEYKLFDKFHSPPNNEPAMTGTLCILYYKAGLRHRENDEPALINKHSGKKEWYYKGKLHRDHGKPARVGKSYTERWIHGVLQLN